MMLETARLPVKMHQSLQLVYEANLYEKSFFGFQKLTKYFLFLTKKSVLGIGKAIYWPEGLKWTKPFRADCF